MSIEFTQKHIHHGAYYPELPPHIPRVRVADRARVLTFLEQTRAEQELFESTEMSTVVNNMMDNTVHAAHSEADQPSRLKVPAITDLASQVGNAIDDKDVSLEPAETAQYHQIVRITLNPLVQNKKGRVFIIYRSKLFAASARFQQIDNATDLQHLVLSDVNPRIFELFFNWVNTAQFKHTNAASPTMLELADLWNLGERFEAARLQNQVMDRLCTLHNEKRLDVEEFGKFMESLRLVDVENGHLSHFFKLVLKKYPDWKFFCEMLKGENPRRRRMCLNMIWGDGSGREYWKIFPEAHGLYVREHIADDEDLIEL